MLNPSTIDPHELPSVPLTDRASLPECPALYFAIAFDNRILYIGRTCNLRQRWVSHHKYSELLMIDGVRLAWCEVSDLAFLIEIESVLIDYFNPPLNLVGKTDASIIDVCAGKQMAQLRERAGLTQRQVADVLGKTDQTVSNWENGIRVPRLTPKETLILCKVLKCTLEELAGELGEATS